MGTFGNEEGTCLEHRSQRQKEQFCRCVEQTWVCAGAHLDLKCFPIARDNLDEMLKREKERGFWFALSELLECGFILSLFTRLSFLLRYVDIPWIASNPSY